MIEIPLTNSAEQRFSVQLEGETYDFRVIYNSRAGFWTADISQGGAVLAYGVGLVAGINILDQFNFSIDRLYVVNLDETSQDPLFDGFGTTSKLFSLSEEEVASVETV